MLRSSPEILNSGDPATAPEFVSTVEDVLAVAIALDERLYVVGKNCCWLMAIMFESREGEEIQKQVRCLAPCRTETKVKYRI